MAEKPMMTHVVNEIVLTHHLSAEEYGTYRRLRYFHHEHGRLPEDEQIPSLTNMTASRWDELRDVVMPLLEPEKLKLVAGKGGRGA